MQSSPSPDFVCIGAQKAGTTWLYENLYTHPDMWLPPVKELHYFNRVRTNEILLGDWEIPHPEGFYNRYLKNNFPPNIGDIRWMKEFYRYRLSRQWYLNLFDNKYSKGKVCGDITPGYSTLDDSGVRYARKVLGSEIPIILILRNPIERSWSSAKMMFRYFDKDYKSGNYAEIATLLKTPYLTLCSDYSNIITRWQTHFQNVHILTYDKLCASPSAFLQDVSKLLDIRDQWDDEKIGKRVWGDVKNSPIPADIHVLLKEQYYAEMERLLTLTGLSEVKQWITATDTKPTLLSP